MTSSSNFHLAYLIEVCQLHDKGIVTTDTLLSAIKRLANNMPAPPMPDEHPLVGCRIKRGSYTVTIAKLHTATNWGTRDNPDWQIEFVCTRGITRYWKQNYDGGVILPPESTS